MADVLEVDNAEEFEEEHISKLKEKAKRLVINEWIAKVQILS